jgi:hypothetical protein
MVAVCSVTYAAGLNPTQQLSRPGFGRQPS